MKSGIRNRFGVFFGLNVADRYSEIFLRMGRDKRLPGWKHDAHVVSGIICAGQDELVGHIDELMRDLERLKKWAIKRVEL
jgi:hypothetical protein